MDEQHLQLRISPWARSITLRDVLTPVFRHKRLVLLSFVGIVLGALLTALILPKQYESQLKIFVRPGRVDPLVTSDRNSPLQSRPEISDEELNSEVELLKSRDLLEKVVLACGLHLPSEKSVGTSGQANSPQEREMEVKKRVSGAVGMLQKRLQIETVKKTSLIKVTFEVADPNRAAQVLTELANAYLEKHVAVHRPPGAFDFF